MPSNPEPLPISKSILWTGYIISGLVVLALTISGVMKFMPPNEQMIEGLKHLGWDIKLVFALGILELTCVALYAIPRTSVLGAILVAGYMGGAIATHVRVGDPFVAQAIFGVLAWLGLWLRDPRVRALLPLRS